MEHTWASGAIELLQHADAHIPLDRAFDRRIAFISVDNAVETLMRAFLSLPFSRSGIQVSRRDLEAAENSFPQLTALLWQHAASKLTGIDNTDIEYYHRIRNKLYHDGTGLSVDDQYLLAYRRIAVLLLKNLFDIDFGEARSSPTLERLIGLWNQIQKLLEEKYRKAGVEWKYTPQWEQATQAGLISTEDLKRLTELRTIRTDQVQSTEPDRQQIQYAVRLAESLLASLRVA